MFKPFLPPELLLPIFQFIHPTDFDYKLCLVSHTFRANVETHFYKYVSVPEKRLLYFCRTMFARPDLARRVQRLAFTGAVHRQPEPGDTELVVRMMKLLDNLKDLCISSSIYIPETGEREREWPVNRDDVRILYDCPFKLERLDCMFTWGEPLARWLATQPQLVAFEHDGYPRGEVRLGSGGDGDGDDEATMLLMQCSYLRITPYILECFEGREREKKPQPVALRFDMRFITVQQEFDAARSLGDMCQNLKCLTLTRQISTTGEYLSTSRILRSFAEKAPKLTCLAIYENIDYSAGENKRILRIIKEHFSKLQVFVWAPLNYPVNQDDDGYSSMSSSSGFSIDSCTEKEEYSFDKTERYAFAMFEAVPALRMFISYRKGPCYVWRRIGPAPPAPAPASRDSDESESESGNQGEEARSGSGSGPEPRPVLKRTWLSIPLSEDTFRAVDPDQPIDLFVTNVPYGPPLAAPRIINIYNAPIVPPVSRSAKTFQEL